MGLFDKKVCDVCGGQIGLLGNRKLSDGNLCKDCAAKLSPFFTGRKKSTVADIKAQLAYREENKKNLAAFHPTLTIDAGKYIAIDEAQRKFIVTNSSNWSSQNPDIIDFAMVTQIEIIIDEDKDEVMDKDAEGKEVSFDPPKFEYEYDFKVNIYVNHPYFDDINIDFSGSEDIDSPESEAFKACEEKAKLFKRTVLGNDVIDQSNITYVSEEPVSLENAEPVELIPEGFWKCECGALNSSKFCTQCGKPQVVAPVVKFCPECGHELNGAKFCPECGTKIG